MGILLVLCYWDLSINTQLSIGLAPNLVNYSKCVSIKCRASVGELDALARHPALVGSIHFFHPQLFPLAQRSYTTYVTLASHKACNDLLLLSYTFPLWSFKANLNSSLSWTSTHVVWIYSSKIIGISEWKSWIVIIWTTFPTS